MNHKLGISTKAVSRTVVAVLALGLLLTPALLSSASSAATSDPKYRTVSAPNVFYPVTGSRAVKDLKNYTSRHLGTDIKAPCGVNVYATHPGVAQVVTSTKWYNKYAVRVVSNSGGLVVTNAYLSRAVVKNGQIIQAGQWIGSVGKPTRTSACKVYVAVQSGAARYNPSAWLNAYVGKPAPVWRLFGNLGFNLASFNVLGASHTTASSRYATYAPRMAQSVSLIQSRKLDVIGFQEFQDPQKAEFLRLTGEEFGIFHVDSDGDGPKRGDTDNALAWRKSTMEFVEGHTFAVPYFGGNPRRMPAVLLREKATGLTAWFINVHNPANTEGPAQQWRDQAVAIEKQKIIDLRATGRPVFLTGDFNDREEAFCPLTANLLSISPNSIPSYRCALPRQFSIDWIFAAGQTRFSTFVRDTYTQTARISDHPIVITRAHLQY
jgi:endonuclease/exonuclease/phosphatase family metal-dependent hydrolase